MAFVIVDYHMHLRDRHGDQPDGLYLLERVERYVAKAAEMGVDEIGFSDHIYHFSQARHLWNVPWMLARSGDNLDGYVSAVEQAKERGLPVKLGLEVDYSPGAEDAIAEVLGRYDWDYLLGSVHFVDGLSIDMEPSLIALVGVDEAWARYFDWLGQAGQSGLFDVLAHPDLVKFFGQRPDDDTTGAAYRQALEGIASSNVCLEVSTAGLHKPVGEIYPDQALLTPAFRSGIPITLASDAHVPEHVGRDLDRAIEHARYAGYETVTVFEGRRRRQEPLG